MRVKNIPSCWLKGYTHRLSASPFLSEAIASKELLKKIKTDEMESLLADGKSGIVISPYFKRIYVESLEDGRLMLGNTDILMQDYSSAKILSNKVIDQYKGQLSLKYGSILVTCFGTVGLLAYCRKDMENCVASTNFLRIQCDSELILSGYLYAFLSSRHGMALVSQGTTGSVIPNLSPKDLYQMPIPRFSSSLEQEIHESIEIAAEKRSKASALKIKICELVQSVVDLDISGISNLTSIASSKDLGRRLDAFYFSNKVTNAKRKMSVENSTDIGTFVEDVFEPNRGKRYKVESEEFGIPFLSSSAVFSLDPTGEYLISTVHTPHINSLIVSDKDLLVPRSGQLGGIIGKAVLPLPTYYGNAASEHLVRIRCYSREDAFYLWAVLISKSGYYSTIGTAFGSSIPSLDCELIKNLQVPVVDDITKNKIVDNVRDYVTNLTVAIELEREAIRTLEMAIEAAAPKH